ncbi:hypothetical protein [Mammaliicoccus sciuri]|uniref:hypothetical protein n=1 Tax=Mammaliicoccus sciuri TaxID=1296 RepID=UPI0021D1CB00|nr:hypothetical protein [Mammaliicoccus sciuri]UXV31922.1 hypothetical protein MUA60_13420 [Mammaliicoccus sciuri]
MDYKTFKEHMDDNLESLDSFYNKVTEFQLDKNKSRAKKSRWNDAKVQRAIDNQFPIPIQERFRRQIVKLYYPV